MSRQQWRDFLFLRKRKTMRTLFLMGIISVLYLVSSCEKDKALDCTDNANFNSYVSSKDYSGTLPIVNDYLASIDQSLSDSSSLVKLRDWLKCKRSVNNAEILHINGILTLPTQSELRIIFQDTTLILDVSSSRPMLAGGFHESD